MSELKRVRDALANKDRAAQDFIKTSDIKRLTEQMADDKIDTWTEENAWKKPDNRNDIEKFIGVDVIKP